MTLSDLENNIDIQVEVRCYYYDEQKEERIALNKDQAEELEIQNMYIENEAIIVEVEIPEEE